MWTGKMIEDTQGKIRQPQIYDADSTQTKVLVAVNQVVCAVGVL